MNSNPKLARLRQTVESRLDYERFITKIELDSDLKRDRAIVKDNSRRWEWLIYRKTIMNKGESFYTWHLSLRVDRPVEVRILLCAIVRCNTSAILCEPRMHVSGMALKPLVLMAEMTVTCMSCWLSHTVQLYFKLTSISPLKALLFMFLHQHSLTFYHLYIFWPSQPQTNTPSKITFDVSNSKQ